jgi:uncharacterized protein (DUF305 family)
METKPLLFGIVGFILGGLLVSVAATTFDKPANDMSMDDMVKKLEDKKGDRFDEQFLTDMIVHHEGAVDMAKLAEKQAKHAEVKALSKEIITAQEKEIKEMKQWQQEWGYQNTDHMNH